MQKILKLQYCSLRSNIPRRSLPAQATEESWPRCWRPHCRCAPSGPRRTSVDWQSPTSGSWQLRRQKTHFHSDSGRLKKPICLRSALHSSLSQCPANLCNRPDFKSQKFVEKNLCKLKVFRCSLVCGALLQVFQALGHILAELPPLGDAQSALQTCCVPLLGSENLPQRQDLFLSLPIKVL